MTKHACKGGEWNDSKRHKWYERNRDWTKPAPPKRSHRLNSILMKMMKPKPEKKPKK